MTGIELLTDAVLKLAPDPAAAPTKTQEQAPGNEVKY